MSEKEKETICISIGDGTGYTWCGKMYHSAEGFAIIPFFNGIESATRNMKREKIREEYKLCKNCLSKWIDTFIETKILLEQHLSSPSQYYIPINNEDITISDIKIVNPSKYLKDLVQAIDDCNYTCDAGELKRNVNWIELKRQLIEIQK